MPKYDLALSFAGEQRDLARSLADRLDSAGYAIFFDEFQQGELWGRDLTVALGDVYARDARWCLVLLSKEYVAKPWTNLERQSALFRFMTERAGYLLCLKLDDSDLPGLPGVIAYQDIRKTPLETIYGLLLQRLGPPSHDDFISSVPPPDRELARRVIEACYRRAIYTRMDAEIHLQAMYRSIGEAIGLLHSIQPKIVDQRLQHLVTQIVRALDDIQRLTARSQDGFSNNLDRSVARHIDDQKRQVVRLLLEIRRAAAIAMQLPFALAPDHFWSEQSAREPPRIDA